MLSDNNVRKINYEIEGELRRLRFANHDESLEIIERVAAMKTLLDPTPTVADICAAIKDKPQLPDELVIDLNKIFAKFCRS